MTADVVDAIIVPTPGTELATHQAAVIEEYRPRIIMAPEEASELDKQLRAMMLAVLKQDVDYGVIPGTGTKPTLLKPGAEKLLQWFGFGHDMQKDEVERDGNGARIGVTYRCIVTKDMPDGRKVAVATCEGYAGYDEDRFYASAEAARAKAEANERKWALKDKRAPIPAKWENAIEYRAPWNSVIKMAQKRALVGATLQATSASTLFTQDLEDMRDTTGGGDGKFTDAANAAIMKLPEEVRGDLDRWFKGKGWPSPDRWTPEQWCSALQASGFLSERRQAVRRPQDTTGQQAQGTDPAGDGPEAAFVTDLLCKLADVTDQLGIDARKFEVDRALADHVIGARVSSELHQAIADKARAIRKAAA